MSDDQWTPSLRYPDPHVTALDPRFKKSTSRRLSSRGAAPRPHALGRTGPVHFWRTRLPIRSDIPNNRMLKWDEDSGAVSVFRKPSNFANGNTRDRQGRLITCEHLGRVVRTEIDGSITVIADKFEGKRLNSPNDVVVKSDGSIWFTDPRFGLLATTRARFVKANCR